MSPVHDDLAELRERFTAHLWAAPGGGHLSGRIRAMLHELGGVETARHLVMRDTAPSGFSELAQRQRLDLTIEQAVVDPQFEKLWRDTPEVREAAQFRLDNPELFL